MAAGSGSGRGRKRGWRIVTWRRGLAGGFLLIAFAVGFYIAGLYGEISAMIEQRRAALSSAIYSAPLVLTAGDDIAQLHVTERLDHLSYTRTEHVGDPGEYAQTPGAITLYTRGFRVGVRDYPPAMVRVVLNGNEVEEVSDQFGGDLKSLTIEPEVIGRLMPGAPAERVEVRLPELKPYFTKGLLATEDRFFYYHPGFDPIRIVEAALIDLRAGRAVQGASTLTQQLARTFLPRQGRTMHRKFRELAIAVVLEIRLRKDEILERYVNDVELGEYHGAPIYGMPLAARYFFNKDLREVTPAEAATLIGMVRAPTLYDPRHHPEACRARRDTVLALMRRAGVIDEPTYASASVAPLTLAKDTGARQAPYFADYVTSLVRQIPGFDGHLEGLKVYTTLDPELQAEAHQAVSENLARLEAGNRRLRRASSDGPLQSSMVVLDAKNGAILAMIGGRDYSSSQFNRAVLAQRQPGSAFKPIVYLAAMDPDRSTLSPPLTVASVLPDRPMSFGGWAPVNYERTYRGEVTVADTLAESLNVPTAYVGSLIGPEAIVRTAHELGIREDLPAVLPIAIGADETTLLELTSAYQVFADGGIRETPYAIESVVDRHDHLIFHHEADEKRVASEQVAYVMTVALEGVLKYGTAASAERMGLDFPAAGKTGTTDDYKDAYFIGYTPRLVCGVWAGFDEPRSLGLPGASAALPAWISFMTKAAPAKAEDFERPDGIQMAVIDLDSGGLATVNCPHAAPMAFLAGSEPTRVCPVHGGGWFSSPALAGGSIPPPPASDLAQAPPAAGGVPGAPPSRGFLGAVGSFVGGLFGR
jgi:penicillin-binding protein 1B